MTHNCRTAARKFSVFPKVWELAYHAAYFQICDCTFQNTSDYNFNYITIISETWIYLLSDKLSNNVMKKYAELSVGVYKQHRNNDVTCRASFTTG